MAGDLYTRYRELLSDGRSSSFHLSKFFYSLPLVPFDEEVVSLVLKLKSFPFFVELNLIDYMRLMDKELYKAENGKCFLSREELDSYGVRYQHVTVNTIGDLRLCCFEALVVLKYEMSRYINERKLDLRSLDEVGLAQFNDVCDRFRTYVDSDSDENFEFKLSTYSELAEMSANRTNGFLSHVSELDDITRGFQRGCVGSIAAFTGHGKSTFLNSIIYNTVMDGHKALLFSLEMPPEIVMMQLEAHYLYEHTSNCHVNAQDLQFRTVPDSIAKSEEFKKAEGEFFEKFSKNLIIWDESVLTKEVIGDFRSITALYKRADTTMGGLDFVGWDHVGQLELMFPEMGNIAVRNITSTTKTFLNSNGDKTFTMLCVQTNRQGWKSASRKGGKYDLTAIAELNEVERSSSYVVFVFLPEATEGATGYTKVSMAKHRFGCLTDPEMPIEADFLPEYCYLQSSSGMKMSGSSDLTGEGFVSKFDTSNGNQDPLVSASDLADYFSKDGINPGDVIDGTQSGGSSGTMASFGQSLM